MNQSRYEISDDANVLNQEIDDTNFPRSNSSLGNGSVSSLNGFGGGTTAFAARRRSSSLRKTESESFDDESGQQQQQPETNGETNGTASDNTTTAAGPGVNRAQPAPLRTTSFSGEVFDSGTVPNTPRTILTPGIPSLHQYLASMLFSVIFLV